MPLGARPPAASRPSQCAWLPAARRVQRALRRNVGGPAAVAVHVQRASSGSYIHATLMEPG
jgi:hypothetical protein